MALTYSKLTKKNPEYNDEYWQELKVLANGGSDMDREWMEKILPRKSAETQLEYQRRIDSAYHIPYLGQMISYYVSALSTDPVCMDTEDADAMPEYYDSFEKTVSRSSGIPVDLMAFLQEQAEKASLTKTAWTLVDFPQVAEGEEPQNKLEEEMRGTNQAYLCQLDPCEVFNWKEDDDGNLEWVVVHCSYLHQESIDDDTEYVKETFTCWYADRWERYTYKYKKGKKPTPKQEPDESESGNHSFGVVPVVRLVLPDALYMGNKLGSICKKITQEANALDYALAAGLYQFPVAYLSGQDMAAPNEIAEDADRATNQVVGPTKPLVLASGDKFEFPAGNARPYDFAQKHIEHLREEAARIINQSALQLSGSSSAAAKRSAESKKLDMLSMEIILKHLGKLLKQYAECIFQMVARGRGENIAFVASGAEDFQMFSVDDLIQQATGVNALNIPSPTFKADYMYEIIKAQLIGHPEERLEQMYAELQSAYTLQLQANAAQQKAAMAEAGGEGQRDSNAADNNERDLHDIKPSDPQEVPNYTESTDIE